jgi:hypothetical protein
LIASGQGDDRDALSAYLADVQTKLDLPTSDASGEIADRSIARVKGR